MKTPINKIKASPFQERKTFTDIQSLADQMEKTGFWGSLRARKKGDHYEVAYGERRLLAARKAGIKEIDLDIVDIDDKEMMAMTTLENSMRVEVEPLERAEHIARVQKLTGWTERELCKNLWLMPATVHDYLSLARARVDTKKLVSSGKIGWSTAIKAEQVGGIELVKTAIKENLTQDDITDIKKAIEVAPKRKKELVSRELHPIELETERIKQSKDSPDDKAYEITKAILLCCQKVRYLSTIFHRLSLENQRQVLSALKTHNQVFAELQKKGEMMSLKKIHG